MVNDPPDADHDEGERVPEERVVVLLEEVGEVGRLLTRGEALGVERGDGEREREQGQGEGKHPIAQGENPAEILPVDLGDGALRPFA